MPAQRGYVAGKYGLDLDGTLAGWVWSVEGGQPSSEVVLEKLGADHIVKKHIAGVKYEDISLQCGTGMSRTYYQWIRDTLDLKYSRKNGAIITADYDHKEMSRRTFFNALVSEFGMPALDAASKEPAKMSMKLTPELTRLQNTPGPSIAGRFAINAAQQKKWLVANFRLRIDGLDRTCSRVNKIEALVMKQKNVEHAVGEMRDYEREPANIEFPNLVFTFPESHADEIYKWFDEFVVQGKCSEDKEKGGSLEYLTPDLKTVLFTLTFKHMGIFKLTPEKVEAGSEQIRRLKAELYCEEIDFAYGSAVWA